MEVTRHPDSFDKNFKRILHPIQKQTPSSALHRGTNQTVQRKRLKSIGKGAHNNEITKNYRTNYNRVGIPFTGVCDTKEERSRQIYPQPQKVERSPFNKTISPDKSFSSSEILTTKRFYDKNRPIPSLFSRANKKHTPQIPCFRLQRTNMEYDVSTIRSCNSPPNICQFNKLGCQLPEERRNTYSSLLGRFFSGQSRRTSFKKPGRKSGETLRVPGLESELAKISSRTSGSTGISWNNVEPLSKQKIHIRNEKKKIKKILRYNDSIKSLVLEDGKISVGRTELRRVRYTTGTTEMPKNSKSEPSSTRKIPSNTFQNTDKNRTRFGMVERIHSNDFSNISHKPRNIPDYRRIKHRLGLSSKQCLHERDLVIRTNELAHKFERDVCSENDNRTESQYVRKQTCPNPIRQHDSSFLYKQGGRNKVSYIVRPNRTSANISTSKENHSECQIHPWKIQFNSRQSIQTKSTSRLASFGESDKNNFSKVGNSDNRSFCNTSISSGSSIRSTITARKRSTICGRLQSKLGLRSCMDLSTASINSESTSSSELSQGNLHTNSPQMAESILATGYQIESHQSSSLHSGFTEQFDRYGNDSSPSSNQQSTFGGLENSGWIKQIEGWNEGDTQLIQSAWRNSTLKTYKAPWSRWVRWAKANNISINDPLPQQVAVFLSHLHRNEHLSYGAILVHKSVISTFANPIKGEYLSSHPIIRHMLKAIGSQRPIQKKFIWDIDILVEWLLNNSPCSNNFYEVSRHVATLLLLYSGRRVHDLTLLHTDENSFEINSDYVIFWPKFGSKTDNSNYQQSGWKIKAHDNENINIIRWIRILNELSSIRKGSKNITTLFITTRGEVKAASRTVIGGWVKSVLRAVGLNVSPGSFRSAVASSSFSKNVPVDTILKQANWKTENTFFKYYCRQILKTSTNKVNDICSNHFEAV